MGVLQANGETAFTDSNAYFGDFVLGWDRAAIGPQGRTASRGTTPNVERPSYFTITAVTTTTLKVEGDADYSTIAASGSTYRVIAPPGIQRSTGTLGTFDYNGDLEWNVQDRGPTYLWAGYQHVPARLGWYAKLGASTFGAQSGWNKLGSYHCNNRVYSPQAG